MGLLIDLATTILATTRDVLPIALIMFGFQLFVLRQPIPNMRRVLIGFVYVLLGLSFFLLGLERALFPLGRLMAEQLSTIQLDTAGSSDVNWADYYWIYLFALAIGFSATIAEPALIAVALKANEVSGGVIGVWGLRISVAIGAAMGISLGALRIVLGAPIHWFIIVCYTLIVIQTYFAPKVIVPLAYDSGGVTTSTVTVPIVVALGLGLAENVPGRSPLIDGFGLIAFVCLFPIMTVMAYAQISQYRHLRAARLRRISDQSADTD
ncbi:MAG: DUF1538 domain-containing protein [Candidatus Competibacteraceae bacterium]|jgi:hypothetical protein|nr:DUF1538 domain-containing protein [Candidatus Competibacteraceae bacterium]